MMKNASVVKKSLQRCDDAGNETTSHRRAHMGSKLLSFEPYYVPSPSQIGLLKETVKPIFKNVKQIC